MREKKYIHIQRGLTGKNNPNRNLCELIEKGQRAKAAISNISAK